MNKTMEALREVEQEFLATSPRVNVITKQTCAERTHAVYSMMRDILAGTFGPSGSNALIYNYPNRRVTKDGFTVVKSLSFDVGKQLIDQSIADSISTISFRLNHTVGDGTTSAIIATAQIFESYLKHEPKLKDMLIMPRDILQAFDDVVREIEPLLDKCAITVDPNDRDALRNFIYQVVFISSNGNHEISDMISDLYYKIGYPSITCSKADGGSTRATMVDGYRNRVLLGDTIYCNNDNATLDISNGADIIIFDCKVTMDVFEHILMPLNMTSAQRNRHLIVVATSYDDMAMHNIKRILNAEFNRTGKINMILCAYAAGRESQRKLLDDFAMLCNTPKIEGPLKRQLLEYLMSDKPIPVGRLFNLNNDGDPNIPAPTLENGMEPVRLGYVKSARLGLKTSTFSGFRPNTSRYEATKLDATRRLKEEKDRYRNLGTFNLAITDAQNRLNSLNLKTGIIEVSGDGDLGQGALKDAVDDAIRAAESAYSHGIINGCNVDLIRCLDQHLANFPDDIDTACSEQYDAAKTRQYVRYIVATIMRDGFIDVYRTILNNAYEAQPIVMTNAQWKSGDEDAIPVDEVVKSINAYLRTSDIFSMLRAEPDSDVVTDPTVVRAANDAFDRNVATASVHELIRAAIMDSYHEDSDGLHLADFLMSFSVLTRTVFDVSTRKFTHEVVNSKQTDLEILRATKDHIANLVSGQFMVVTQKPM